MLRDNRWEVNAVCFQKILVCQQRYIFQKTFTDILSFLLYLWWISTSMFLESNSIVNIAFYDSTVKRSCKIFLNYSDSESFLDKCIIQTKLFFPSIPLKYIWGVIEMDQRKDFCKVCGYLFP